jgi:hypothetical protein
MRGLPGSQGGLDLGRGRGHSEHGFLTKRGRVCIPSERTRVSASSRIDMADCVCVCMAVAREEAGVLAGAVKSRREFQLNPSSRWPRSRYSPSSSQSILLTVYQPHSPSASQSHPPHVRIDLRSGVSRGHSPSMCSAIVEFAKPGQGIISYSRGFTG